MKPANEAAFRRSVLRWTIIAMLHLIHLFAASRRSPGRSGASAKGAAESSIQTGAERSPSPQQERYHITPAETARKAMRLAGRANS